MMKIAFLFALAATALAVPNPAIEVDHMISDA